MLILKTRLFYAEYNILKNYADRGVVIRSGLFHSF